jgi:hypothetical protein
MSKYISIRYFKILPNRTGFRMYSLPWQDNPKSACQSGATIGTWLLGGLSHFA